MSDAAGAKPDIGDLTAPVCRFDRTPHVRDELTGLYFCPDCDRILSRLPQGRTYMLLGGSGVGKSVFLYKLIDLYVRNQKPCVHVSFDEYPEQVRRSMSSFIRGLSVFEEKGFLNFVDCYSCLAGTRSQEKYFINSPGDINELNLKITDLITAMPPDEQPRIFVDSATTMFVHCSSDSVLKFLLALGAKIKPRNGSLLFTLGQGAVAPEVQKRLEQIADGLIEFKSDETPGRIKRYYRISKVRGTAYFDTWLPFFIGKENIYLGPPEDPEARARFDKLFEFIFAEP